MTFKEQIKEEREKFVNAQLAFNKKQKATRLKQNEEKREFKDSKNIDSKLVKDHPAKDAPLPPVALRSGFHTNYKDGKAKGKDGKAKGKGKGKGKAKSKIEYVLDHDDESNDYGDEYDQSDEIDINILPTRYEALFHQIDHPDSDCDESNEYGWDSDSSDEVDIDVFFVRYEAYFN